MRIQIYSVAQHKRAKAAERATDLVTVPPEQAQQRQNRNRFIPNAKDWIIVAQPKPLKKISLR